MKTRRILWMLAVASSVCVMRSQAQEGKTSVDDANSVVATLHVAQIEPLPELRLMVENRGKANVKLLRLRPGWLEYNGGSLYDWQIQIEGPGGAYQFPFYTGLVLPLEEKDFIELAQGEAFLTTIRTEMATISNGPYDAYKVGERDGTYNITVSRGALRSNALKFTVGEPE